MAMVYIGLYPRRHFSIGARSRREIEERGAQRSAFCGEGGGEARARFEGPHLPSRRLVGRAVDVDDPRVVRCELYGERRDRLREAHADGLDLRLFAVPQREEVRYLRRGGER